MGRGVGAALNCEVSEIGCQRFVLSHSSAIIKKAVYASIYNSPITSRGQDVVGYPVMTK